MLGFSSSASGKINLEFQPRILAFTFPDERWVGRDPFPRRLKAEHLGPPIPIPQQQPDEGAGPRQGRRVLWPLPRSQFQLKSIKVQQRFPKSV